VDQFCVIVKREDKLESLRRIIDSAAEFYGLIFFSSLVETDELARRLIEAGYPAEALHGDLSQEIRERTLRRFRLHRSAAANSAGTGVPAILVATDVAARGLDIESLSHVVNWDLPNDRETYVHRIGRTGRAGRRGIAISLVTLAERGRIHQLSRTMEKTLGSGIQWLKVPSVKAVMKSLRRRIASSVVAVLPEQEFASMESAPVETDAALALPPAELPEELPPEAESGGESASPYLIKVCRNLIERLGAEKAVEALVKLSYGDYLDPARYGPITEFSEDDFKDTGRAAAKGMVRGREGRYGRHSSGKRGYDGGRSGANRDGGSRCGGIGDFTRLYVGQGRQHGKGARDIAALLMRAGGVPGRLVDEIEMKDYCSFATLPADAAQKACAFSRKDPQGPVIRAARPPDHAK
jgi:ATP-dependent RNA helicase DeaD